MSERIYLASQSPRRRQLLEQLGVAHDLLLPGADEDAEALEQEREGESPRVYVERVTRAKLEAARARMARRQVPVRPILAADTTVTLDGRILGKPADDAEAAAMLRALSGRTHHVLSAVALGQGQDTLLAVSDTEVRFAPLPAAVIDAYVASGEPRGKAGAYAIQGALAGWIWHVAGSYSGVVGLPLFETADLLRRAGLRFGLHRPD